MRNIKHVGSPLRAQIIQKKRVSAHEKIAKQTGLRGRVLRSFLKNAVGFITSL